MRYGDAILRETAFLSSRAQTAPRPTKRAFASRTRFNRSDVSRLRGGERPFRARGTWSVPLLSRIEDSVVVIESDETHALRRNSKHDG